MSQPAWMANLKKGKKLKKTSAPRANNAALTQARLKAGIGKKKLKKTSGPKSRNLDTANQQYLAAKGKSFTEALDEKSLEYFNEVCTRPFAEQAQFFLNAFWDECGDHAEAIYAIHWSTIKKVEMDSLGIQYVHLYEEGIDLDFDMGLVLFEKLCRHFDENKEDAEQYPNAIPSMMTSVVRKKELRNKVDVNFDGRVGFLEYLLYQFQVSPKTLMDRSTRSTESNPELDAARAALAEVNKRIKAYEAEKARLTKIAESGKGVKALGAKNMLAQIESGPLMEQLRAALITAEAKVRIVARKYKLKASAGGGAVSEGQPRTDGTVWWMKREIKEKKRLYGRKKK